MKRQHLLAVLAAAALMGCRADNGASIEITGRAFPTDVKGCTYSPGGDVALATPVYDPVLGGPFRVALYVRNNLVDPNKIAPGSTTQSNNWSAQSVKVRLNPSQFVDRYHPSPALLDLPQLETVHPLLTSSVVEADGGEATFIVDLLNDGLAAAILGSPDGSVVLGITLQGRVNGDGSRQDSTEFPLPVLIQANSYIDPRPCPTGSVFTLSCDGQVFNGSCR